jgi:hypothetical protein
MKKEMGIVYEFLKLYSCQTREKWNFYPFVIFIFSSDGIQNFFFIKIPFMNFLGILTT